MPSRWRLTFLCDGEPPPARAVRGEISRWLQGHLTEADHHANRPPDYAAGPLSTIDGLVTIDIGTRADDDDDRLLAGAVRYAEGHQVLEGRPFHLIPTPAGAPAHLLAHLEIEAALARAVPAERVILVFDSPTRFRGSLRESVPGASDVFGSLRRRWAFQLDFKEVGLELENDFTSTATMLLSRPTTTPDRGQRISRVGEVGGFVGVATYRVTAPNGQLRRTVDALARLADYLGVGSDTARGMGVTRYLGAGTSHEYPA